MFKNNLSSKLAGKNYFVHRKYVLAICFSLYIIYLYKDPVYLYYISIYNSQTITSILILNSVAS